MSSKICVYESPQRTGSLSCVDGSLQRHALGGLQSGNKPALSETVYFINSRDLHWIRDYLVLLARQELGKNHSANCLGSERPESENLEHGVTFFFSFGNTNARVASVESPAWSGAVVLAEYSIRSRVFQERF